MASSNTTATLPTINLAPFLDPNPSPQAISTTAKALNAACSEYGFFYLTGHGIAEETTDRILSLAREFFMLPREEKEKIKRPPDGYRGYQGLGENVTQNAQDMHEAIDLYRGFRLPTDPQIEGLMGPNEWPKQPPEMEAVYETYIESAIHISRALVKAMGVALNLPPPADDNLEDSERPIDDTSLEDTDVFARNTSSAFWIMRLIGYPPLANPLTASADIESYSCGEHSDYGCVTLLLADATKGALQVRLRDGSYLTVDPVHGAFVVNIGDMIERWTNGLWHSVRHRVIHRGEGYRVSVPFFFEPNFDALVRPLGTCVERTRGEVRFEGVKYGDHLMGKLKGNFYGGDADGGD